MQHNTNGAPSNVLGIFGLSIKTREDKLRREFGKFGEVESVSIIYDHKTGNSRRFAFLGFVRLSDAQAAKKAMDGSLVDERNIRVDFSTSNRPGPAKFHRDQ